MSNIVPPSSTSPISSGGIMTPEFQRWVLSITNLDLFIGTGSPEGNVEATVGRVYLDTTGSTGSILYIKRDADIAGDRTKGWIAV